MRREEVLGLLDGMVCQSMESASNHQRAAARSTREGFAGSAESYREAAERLRQTAAVVIAVINHLNGVSPE